MKNSASEPNLFVTSEDEDDEVLNLEEGKNDPSMEEEDQDHSDDSDCSSPRHATRPSSYNTAWPQSYRQSIDMYGFLGTPTLNRWSNSCITSSCIVKRTPEITTSLTQPLIPATTADDQREEEEEGRKSYHSVLLPPPIPKRRPSAKKIQDDQKTRKFSHELPTSQQCSYGQAVLNGMNVLCGVGILSTPYAVKEGGWMGLSILLLFSVLAFYTGILLSYCLDSKPGMETYPDIGQAAFGTTGRFTISVILYLELYACCVEYIILESDNLSTLFPSAHLDIGRLHLDCHVLFAIVATLVVLPTTWLRDLSLLSYISAGGVVASVLVVLSLFWVGLVDQVGFQEGGTLLNLSGIPISIGIYGYCYSGHAIFPNIYSSLKKPNQYPSVLFTSFAICTTMFAGVGVMGYLIFGESTVSQFTLKMPSNLVASKLAVWTTVVNPVSKYALTLTPLALSLEELIPEKHLKLHTCSIIIRTALVVSTLFVALSVPFFGLVMSLIGSLLTMLITLILPCACFLCIVRDRVTWSQVSLCILIIVVGVVCFTFGTYSALSKIIQKLS